MSGESLVCRSEPEPVFSFSPSQSSTSSQSQSGTSSGPLAAPVEEDPRSRVFSASDPAYISNDVPQFSYDPLPQGSIFSTPTHPGPSAISQAHAARAQQREWRALHPSKSPTGSKSSSGAGQQSGDRTTSNGQTLPGSPGGEQKKGARRVGDGGGHGNAQGPPIDLSGQDAATRMKLALPPPRPATGSISTRREPLFLASTPRGFAAPLSLDAKAAKPTKQSAAEQKAVNPLATDPGLARDSYAEAALASRSLYERLVRAAADLTTAAHAANDTLGTLQQRSLDRQLRGIDDILSARIGDANTQRDFALDHVRSRADLLRAKVRGQAGSALGRLLALAGSFGDKLATPRDACNGALDKLSNAATDAKAAGDDAHFELQAFLADSESYLSGRAPFNEQSAVAAAKLEAAVDFVGPYITADDIDLARRLDTVQQFVKPMLDCLPCEIEGKFQTLQSHVDSLAIAGPKAVRAALDGAIKSINESQDQLELAIYDAHRQTQTAATQQHAATRAALVAQTVSAGASDRGDIAATARRHADTLLGLALAQPVSLTKVHDDLRRSGDLPPARFAPMVIRASRRLKANVEASAERNPAQVLATASGHARARQRRVEGADRDRDGLVTQFGRGLAAMVDGNFRTLGVNNDTVLLGMDGLPAQVGSTCDGFISAADKAMKEGFGKLSRDAAFLVARMTDALDGLVPIAPTEPGSGTVNIASSMLATSSPLEPSSQLMSVAQPLMSVSTPLMSPMPNASSAQTIIATPTAPVTPAPPSGGAPRGTAKAGAAPPQSAACTTCADSQAEAAASAAGSAPNTQNATGGGGGGTQAPGQGPGANVGVSSNATEQRSPRSFRAFADGIAMDVTTAPKVTEFIGRVPAAVMSAERTGLESRAAAAFTALDGWGATDMPALMAALHGLTPKQGAALSEVYHEHHKSRTLSGDITKNARYGFAAGSTKGYNRDAALAALRGDVTGQGGSAINEMRSAFNYSNSPEQMIATLQAMSSSQMAAFTENNAVELAQLIEQLDATQKVEFEQYMTGRMTAIRGQQIKTQIDGITRDYWNGGNTNAERNEKRGDLTGQAIGDLREGTGAYAPTALEGPADHVDTFGLERREVSSARTLQRWTDVQENFGSRQDVVAAIAETLPNGLDVRPGERPPSTLVTYAIRPIQMYPWKDGQYGTRSPYAQPQQTGAQHSPYPPIVSEVDAYHRLWIEMVADKGRDSLEAKAALGLIGIRRVGGQPTQDDLESALHVGTTDARTGGHFESGSAADAERERAKIFVQIERFRRRIEGGGDEHGEISVTDAQAAYRREVEFALRNAPDKQAMALGIVDHEQGNVQAVIDYAIAHENKELLTRYLQRMDSRQIATMVETWNGNHPGGPGLEARLGINGNHWTTTNWNGAVFTGDEANALEIAFMGVPQNDMQRGEVALRVMNQQIDQSGWLGRMLANDEYSRLVENAAALRTQMGVTNADLDSSGHISFDAPGSDIRVRLNFNANGDFVPAHGAGIDAFESAIALGQITATNYTNAVDRIGTIIATVLVVAAAVITTILTGGAAASIWIPMLVTAGAGLAGIGIKMALKGGRYGRDEFTQDIVATVVQTLTAGLGAAAGAAARAGPGSRLLAMRTVASRMRVPFSVLDRFLGKAAMATTAQTLAVNLGTGAGIGAVSGAVTTAFDPAARRSGDYGTRIFHSFLRGGVGGLANAGTNHFVNSRLTGAAQRFATNRAVRIALQRGASPEAAARYAALSMKAFGQSRFVEIGTRSLASGLAGSSSRGIEMGYDNAFAGGHHRAADFASEMRFAFLQNAAQGGLEAIGDRSNRRWSASMHAEHNYTVQQGAKERHEAARSAVEAESIRMGLVPPNAADQAHPETQVALAKGNQDADDIERPVIHAPDPGETAARQRSTPDQDIAELQARAPRGEADPAADPAKLTHLDTDGEIRTAPIRPPASDEPYLRSVVADDPAVARGGRTTGADDDILTVRSRNDEITGEHKALTKEQVAAAIEAQEKLLKMPRSLDEHLALNDGVMRPIRGTADLSGELLFRIGGNMPVGSQITASNAKSAAAARRNYEFLKAAAPNLEVLLVFHPGTGDWMVVQGGPFSASKPGREWIVERHSHPRLISEDLKAQLTRSLPSATDGDFAVLHSEVNQAATSDPGTHVHARVSKIDIEVNGYRSETEFSIVRHGPDDYSLSVTFHHPSDGTTTIGPFKSIAEYEAHAFKLTGVDFSNPGPETVRSIAPGGGDATPGESRAVRGSAVTSEQRTEAMTIGERMTRAAQAREDLASQRPRGTYDPEIAAAAHSLDAQQGARKLGLVGQPDSMIRLHAIINDATIPPAVRAAVARAALDAARFDMVQSGTLKAGDELMMFFHGAPADQAASYDRVGVDMSKVTGGADDDAGRGLYASQDYQSAAGYVEKGGQVFPLLVRRSELGNVIDVRPGTPLHAHWEAFVRASSSHPDAGQFGSILPIYDRPYLKGVSMIPHPTMIFGGEGAGRGLRYQAFLKSLIADTNIAPEIRAAAADPHITLMDLGGIVSWGNDRRMITDQAAIHHQHVADMINEQMGFPKPGQGAKSAETESTGSVRSVQGPDAEQKGAAQQGAAEKAVLSARFGKAFTLAIAHLKASDQSEMIATLNRLHYLDHDDVVRFLTQSWQGDRRKTSNEMAATILGKQMAAGQDDFDHISGTMRDLQFIEERMGARLRENFQHLTATTEPTYVAPTVSTRMAAAVADSPLLHWIATQHPALFAEMDVKYFKKYPNGKQSAVPVEAFVMASLRAQRQSKDAARAALVAQLLDDAELLRPALVDQGEAQAKAIVVVGKEVVRPPTIEQGTAVPPAEKQFADRTPYIDPLKVKPGMIIDHVDLGRGTVINVNGDTVEIRFLSQTDDATPISVLLSEGKSYPGRDDNATDDIVAPEIRSAGELATSQKQIDQVRVKEGFGPFAKTSKAGTVSIAVAGDVEAVGTNSTLTSRSVNLTKEDRADLAALIKMLGIDKHGTTNDSRYVHHAELASLINLRAKLREQNKPMPHVVELFVDRNTCPSCMKNLDLVAAYLSIGEIRVYPRARPLLIRRPRR